MNSKLHNLHKIRKLGGAALPLLLIFCLAVPATRAGGKRPLRVGFHVDQNGLEEHYTKKDITVATQLLFGKMLSQGDEFEPTFRVFDEKSRFVEAIKAGELDYVEIDPLVLLRLPQETRAKITPLSIVQLGEERLERFVLLAAPGATLKSLADKRLRLYNGRDRGIGRLWLERELQLAGLGNLETHFASVESFSKQEPVLLPTFFGKSEACLVREEDYKVVSELNPQISQRLKPIETSPSFPFIITAATGPSRDLIVEILGGNYQEQVTNTSSARQALSLLRLKNLIDYRKGDLEALEVIVRAHGGAGEAKGKATVTSTTETDGE